MKVSSLRFTMQWVKFKIETGPQKDWYDEKQRKRRKTATMLKLAQKKTGYNEFKPKNRNYRYGGNRK